MLLNVRPLLVAGALLTASSAPLLAQTLPTQQRAFFALFDQCSSQLKAATLQLAVEQIRADCSEKLQPLLMPGIKDWVAVVSYVNADSLRAAIGVRFPGKRDLNASARFEDVERTKTGQLIRNEEYHALVRQLVALNLKEGETILISGLHIIEPRFYGNSSLGGVMKFELIEPTIRRP